MACHFSQLFVLPTNGTMNDALSPQVQTESLVISLTNIGVMACLH